MANVVLRLTGDNSDAENALQETAQTLAGVNSMAKKTSSEIKKGFEEVAVSAKKANDEMSNPKPSENQKKVLNATQQLKKEIKELEAAALAAGEGTAEFARNIALAGQKKADLKDLKEAIAALDPDAVAKTFLGLASSVAGVFSVAQSAIALTGTKSAELEQALLKVQAAQGLLAGLQQLANTQDEVGKAKLIILNKLNTLEVKKGIVAVQGATVAQRIWNLVMASNPIGLLVAGLTVLAGIAAAYISQTGTAAKAEEQRSTAIDGTIIKSKELRDAYNESIVALKEVENQYAVLNGTLTETEAALDNLAQKNRIAVQEIQNETKAKITETGGVYNQLFELIKTGGNAGLAAIRRNAEVLNIEVEGAEKLKAIKLKQNADEAKILADQAKKDADEKARKQKEANDKYLAAEKSFLDAIKDLRDKARQAEINALTGSERIEAERKLNQESIDELEKTFIAKGKLLNGSFKLSEEQEKQFAILRNQIDADANNKLLKQKTEFRERATADEEKANQDAIDFANQLIEEQRTALEDANKVKILLTKEGTKERLDAEIEAIEKERDFVIENTKLTSDQRIIIEQEALQKISDLQKEFGDKNKFDLAKLLGVSDAQLEKIKGALNKAGAEIGKFIDAQFDAQNKLLDDELKANDDRKKLSEDKIKSLEDQLNTELDLQRQGLANNVDDIRNAIAAEQAAKNAGLENEKRIKAEKKKLAIAQLAIDSATQISDLVTASTEIYKSLASLGPIGIALAIGTIGLMIGSFISAKSKAVQAINQGFKDGGYTGDVGETEVAGHVHGREFVSTAKTTKKHRNLLEALHSEDYSKLERADLAPLLAGTGVTFNKEAMKELRVDQANYSQRKANEPNHMLKAMEVTNKKIDSFYNHIKNKPDIQQYPDKTIIKTGSTTRIIRKK